MVFDMDRSVSGRSCSVHSCWLGKQGHLQRLWLYGHLTRLFEQAAFRQTSHGMFCEFSLSMTDTAFTLTSYASGQSQSVCTLQSMVHRLDSLPDIHSFFAYIERRFGKETPKALIEWTWPGVSPVITTFITLGTEKLERRASRPQRYAR